MGKRNPVVAGNWKMNLTHHEAVNHLGAFSAEAGIRERTSGDIAVIPSFTALPAVQGFVEEHNLPIAYGAQDLSPFPSGAYTGDVSGSMLASLGCTYVLVGHSERRQHHAESDNTVQAKTQAAFNHRLTPIICVGEGLEARRQGGHVDVTLEQVRAALANTRDHEAKTAVIAYEPVWAIGTGEVATPADAQEVCAAIRAQICETFTPELSEEVRVIYGGSVTPTNITDIMTCPDVDGALVGGASLDPTGFAAICRAVLGD